MPQTTHSRLSVLWADAEQLLGSLGDDGGLMSPSIYDTAQLLRHYPPANPWPAIDWLLAQQEPDGGWATPAAPLARYMPTLATLLALNESGYKRKRTIDAITAGVAFLNRHQWDEWTTLGDDLPGGVELILPRLVDEAITAGLLTSREPYAALIELGNKRRRVIRGLNRLAGTTAAHVWEGWGDFPDPDLVDGSGTVGHSPAASAVWWAMAAGYPELAEVRQRVKAGLDAAWAATTSNIEGVICSCWPITHFERAFSLYPFLIAELIPEAGPVDCPEGFAAVAATQLSQLNHSMSEAGLGFSDWFLPDGDDTAVALAVLARAGYTVDRQALMHFASDSGTHFCAWRGELQSSPTVTAHAIHALTIIDPGANLERYCAHLLSTQLPKGLWPGEKWNASPIYTTTQSMIALLEAGMPQPIERICSSLTLFQHPDGGWGMRGSSMEETAYTILALLAARRRGALPAAVEPALVRARDWMFAHYQPFAVDEAAVWLGKETYRPLRISRAFALAAMIAILQQEAAL